MSEEVEVTPENELLSLPGAGDTKIAPAQGIAALAMNFATKFWDLNTIKDGVLYQQLKLEGKNIRPGVHLDEVFEVARRIEIHLMGADKRLTLALLESFEELDAELKQEPETNDTEGQP